MSDSIETGRQSIAAQSGRYDWTGSGVGDQKRMQGKLRWKEGALGWRIFYVTWALHDCLRESL